MLRVIRFAIVLAFLSGSWAFCSPRPKLPKGFVWDGHGWMILHNDLICGVGFAGCTVFPRHVIYLCSDLPMRETDLQYSEPEVLYHELEHVVTGYGFADRTMTGHDAIDALEPMSKLLGRNPQLGRYFVAAAEAR